MRKYLKIQYILNIYSIHPEPYLILALEPFGAAAAVALLIFVTMTAIDAVERIAIDRRNEWILPRLLV